MNILEAEDMVKGLPDQVLFQYAQNPPPQIPQYLAVSEVQRRQEMRQRFQAQSQGQQPTVMDQILQGGSPEQAPPGGPPGGPPGAAPPGAPMEQPMTGAPMGGMFRGGMTRMSNGGLTPGGIVYMQEGRTIPNFLSAINSKLEEYSNANRARTEGVPLAMRIIPRSQDPNAVIAQAKDLVRQGRTQEAVGLLSQQGIDPSVLQAAPAAPRPAAAPVRPPAVEAGIPAAGAALTANAPPAAAPAPPVAPPMAAAVTPPVAPPMAAAVTPPVAPPATSQVTPPAAQPAGPVSDYQSRVDQLTGSLPGIMGQIQGLMPQAPSLTLKDLERFAPKPFDDSATMARREALLNQLQQTGRTRREEDIAAAERYRSEAETPIQSAQEEARKTAIASTLMRLGAGLAAGNPAQGLANASEAVENIMTRAREQASAERRAARQEFRQAERDATRGERDVANTVFQMQAQQITSDENKQRELTRDQMQFAQWAFGQIRDQGRDARQAYTDAMRLSLDVSKAVQSVLNEELKNERISKDQYTAVAGALLRTVNETLRQNPPENMDFSTPKGRQDFNDMAIDLAKTQLQSIGISSPDNLAVTSFEEVSPKSLKVNGHTINFKTEEQANAFKKSIGR